MFQLTPNTILDNICTIAVVLVALYNYYCMKTNKKGTGYFLFVVFILCYSLFYRPIIGDFWHSLVTYQQGPIAAAGNLEPFYYLLMSIIPNNYLLWRIAIWLPAAIMIMICFKYMNVPSSYATTFFLVFGLAAYYYTRNALAYSVLYCGMVLFCFRDKFTQKTMFTIVSFALIFVSWYLHKSMPMYIGIALLSLVLPFNKNVFIGVLIILPALYGIIISLGADILNLNIWSDNETAMHYLEGEAAVHNYSWKDRIIKLFLKAPVIYFYIIAIFHPLPKSNSDFSFYKVFLYYSYFVVMLSLLFYEQGSHYVQGRIYKGSLIPFAFVASLYFKNCFGSRQCMIFVYLTILSLATSLFTLIRY